MCVYQALLTQDPQEGSFLVTFRDFPEVITQGESADEAMANAVDALNTAFIYRVLNGEPIPKPSQARAGEQGVSIRTQVLLKFHIKQAMDKAEVSRTEMALRMNLSESSIRRMLDLREPTKVERLECALLTLGQQPVVDFMPASVA